MHDAEAGRASSTGRRPTDRRDQAGRARAGSAEHWPNTPL
jgi:hypothetical protein